MDKYMALFHTGTAWRLLSLGLILHIEYIIERGGGQKVFSADFVSFYSGERRLFWEVLGSGKSVGILVGEAGCCGLINKKWTKILDIHGKKG
ncbi:MAG: hypothetical protein Q4D55_03070 [Eubacteriales bacterium]|nr:hypothetical protein [Eubacteriales bacterium]